MIQDLYSELPIWMQNIAVSSYGRYLRRMRYAGRFSECLEQLGGFPWRSEEQLEEIESRKLQTLIRHSYENVPYYRELFDSHGIRPDSIQERSDLKRIPPLEKESIRRNPDQFLSKTANRRDLHVAYTSGSTGTPLKLFQSREIIHWMYACHSVVRKWAGLPRNPRRATFGGRLIVPKSQSKPPFWRWNSAEHQLLFSSYHLSAENLSFYARRLHEFQPLEIVGYPSAIYLVARYLVENGITNIRPTAVLTNSETLFASQREIIEKAFACSVYDWYSSEEFVFFAAQCEQANAYHVFPSIGILEIAEPMSQTAGGPGEIVGTTLINNAMPLIRYRMGDVGVPVPAGSQCRCGRQTHLLRMPLGRTDDYVIAEDGSPVGRLDHVFKGLPHVVESQIIQEERGSIRVLIHPAGSFNKEDENILATRLRERLGNLAVTVERVLEIPKTSQGKLRSVVSKISREGTNWIDQSKKM